METPTLKKIENNASLTHTNFCKIMNNRISINTLVPGFNYINNKGEIVVPDKRVFL